jgi:hypothetical protein
MCPMLSIIAVAWPHRDPSLCTESLHLEGSAHNEHPIFLGAPNSTTHESGSVSQNLSAASQAMCNSAVPPFQLLALTGLSSLRSHHQSTIPECHVEDQRKKCDMAWAEFFYSTNIPFAAARSPSFRKAVKMTFEMKRSYLSSSYHEIWKRLLNDTKDKIKTQIQERRNIFIRTYGCTLSGDGWSSVNNHPLLNMMCVFPASEESLGAIDTSGHTKDAVYIVDVMKRFMVEVAHQNVVQICTENASVMRKAVSIVQEEWPHIYFQGCMAHAVNLLLQDWGLLHWACSVVEDAQKIVKFVKLRHAPLALFRKHAAIHAQGLSLLSPGATRFATNFLMVVGVLEVMEALKQTVIDVAWDRYVRTLSNTQRKPVHTQAQEVRRLILSDGADFWQSLANYCTVMKATVAALKEFDGSNHAWARFT